MNVSLIFVLNFVKFNSTDLDITFLATNGCKDAGLKHLSVTHSMRLIYEIVIKIRYIFVGLTFTVYSALFIIDYRVAL